MTGPSRWLDGWLNFEPADEDGRDFALYFSHKTARGLNDWQRRRWNSVNRRLNGRGWRLQLYYTNNAKLSAPSLAQLLADDLYAKRRRPVADFVPWAEDAWTRLNQSALVTGVSKSTADISSARVSELIRLNNFCVEMLRDEYKAFSHGKSQDLYAAVPRSKLAAYLGAQHAAPLSWHSGRSKVRPELINGEHIVDEWLLTCRAELSTWLDIRLKADNVRHALVKHGKTPYAIASGLSERKAIDQMLAEVEAMPELEQEPPAPLPDLGGGDWVREFLREPLPKFLEKNPERTITTVSEVARVHGLKNTTVRSMLKRGGCPNASEKRGKLPLTWFITERGREFHDAANLERLAASLN
jgi:hypothetical protein